MIPPSRELQDLEGILQPHYALEREIGRGGVGVVFLARDHKLDRDVAIKALPLHLADDQRVRERFLREARCAARLSHPNIVPGPFGRGGPTGSTAAVTPDQPIFRIS